MVISGGGNWSASEKVDQVNAAVTKIRSAFSKSPGFDPSEQAWTTRIENLLQASLTEAAAFDFKQGFAQLSEQRLFDANSFSEAIKTLTAMANCGPDWIGYLVVGVLDRKEHAVRFKNLTKAEPIKFAGRYICGIDNEAETISGSVDKYMLKLNRELDKQPIDSRFKSLLQQNFFACRYADRHLLIIRVRQAKEPVLYDDAYWVRRGSTTQKLPMVEVNDLFQRFNQPVENRPLGEGTISW